MLKLFLASSAIALAAAFSGVESTSAPTEENAQCTPAQMGHWLSSTNRRTSQIEPNPEGDSSERLLESLCIVIRQR